MTFAKKHKNTMEKWMSETSSIGSTSNNAVSRSWKVLLMISLKSNYSSTTMTTTKLECQEVINLLASSSHLLKTREKLSTSVSTQLLRLLWSRSSRLLLIWSLMRRRRWSSAKRMAHSRKCLVLTLIKRTIESQGREEATARRLHCSEHLTTFITPKII